MQRTKIYFTGVGGQGTLTATTLFARCALDQGLDVTAGEIHGMAQRGGVVESCVLLGGWKSPRIDQGEADVMLGFEPLETLRGLQYLKRGGLVLSSSESIAPIMVARGIGSYPDIEGIKETVAGCTSASHFLPIQTMGKEAGAQQAGNIALMAALCAVGGVPFGVDALEAAIRKYLRPAFVDLNLKALEMGAQAVA